MESFNPHKTNRPGGKAFDAIISDLINKWQLTISKIYLQSFNCSRSTGFLMFLDIVAKRRQMRLMQKPLGSQTPQKARSWGEKKWSSLCSLTSQKLQTNAPGCSHNWGRRHPKKRCLSLFFGLFFAHLSYYLKHCSIWFFMLIIWC